MTMGVISFSYVNIGNLLRETTLANMVVLLVEKNRLLRPSLHTIMPLFFVNSAYWIFLHALLTSADLFQNQVFLKILSGIPSECQTIGIQIRTDILLVVIWIQTVCKGYQQTRLVDIE